jgi:hypothetical protein
MTFQCLNFIGPPCACPRQAPVLVPVGKAEAGTKKVSTFAALSEKCFARALVIVHNIPFCANFTSLPQLLWTYFLHSSLSRVSLTIVRIESSLPETSLIAHPLVSYPTVNLDYLAKHWFLHRLPWARSLLW